jgi:hypothetical protein
MRPLRHFMRLSVRALSHSFELPFVRASLLAGGSFQPLPLAMPRASISAADVLR